MNHVGFLTPSAALNRPIHMILRNHEIAGEPFCAMAANHMLVTNSYCRELFSTCLVYPLLLLPLLHPARKIHAYGGSGDGGGLSMMILRQT